MSQRELGAPFVSGAAVSGIERGKASPSFKILVHFARNLRVAVRDLIPRRL